MSSRGEAPPWRPNNYGMTYPAQRLDAGQIAAILDTCGDTPVGLRNRALIMLAYRAGLKQVEALAARVEHVHRGTSRLRVIRNGRARAVGLDATALAVLNRWLAVRADCGGDERGLILCSFKSRGMKSVAPEQQMPVSYFRTLLQRAARELGLPAAYLHYASFRNTLFAELVTEGVPLNVIQAHMGLETLQATQTYFKRLELPMPDPASVIARRV